MYPSTMTTLLDLGDATSRNLEFSHGADVFLSYGEETITEMSLLEIRRRHPESVSVSSFSKPAEARSGADWEWHIIGRKRTARMRVQAKRLQCNGVLKIRHTVKSSGKQQRQLLIDGAKADNMKPVYCFYCTERQRTRWKQPTTPYGFQSYETGCLLADACDVPLTTRHLSDIEDSCIPWHFLFERSLFSHRQEAPLKREAQGLAEPAIVPYSWLPISPDAFARGPTSSTGWNAPTIQDLNDQSRRNFDPTGVEEITTEDRARLRPESDEGQRVARYDHHRLCERGIQRMMVIDVREEP